VLLSGDGGDLHARKPEIGVDEVTRQLDMWRHLMPKSARRSAW
jgi:hypothetical protein